MPTVYLDQDGVMYTKQQIEDYDYKRGETIKQWEHVGDQRRLHTIVCVKIYGEAAKQIKLF